MFHIAKFFILLLVISINTFATTASEIYENSKESMVVVYSMNQYGEVYSQGSGVVFVDEMILTNKHVVDGAASIKISYRSIEYKVEVLGYLKNMDIAILSFSDVNIQPIKIAENQGRIGDLIYTLGSPKGLELTIADGIISSYRNDNIQVSAPISPGSSGGALLNEWGELIGITTFTIKGGENLNFAISIKAILDADVVQQVNNSDMAAPLIDGNHLTYVSDTQTIFVNVDDIVLDNGLVYFDLITRSPAVTPPMIMQLTSRNMLNCSSKLVSTISINMWYLNRPKNESETAVVDDNKWTAIRESHKGMRDTYKMLCQYKKSQENFTRLINQRHIELLNVVNTPTLDFREYLTWTKTSVGLTELGKYLAENNPKFIKVKGYL